MDCSSFTRFYFSSTGAADVPFCILCGRNASFRGIHSSFFESVSPDIWWDIQLISVQYVQHTAEFQDVSSAGDHEDFVFAGF